MNLDDRATEAEEYALKVALANQKAKAEQEEKTLNSLAGRCLFCKEKTDPGHRFCDQDCQGDFEKLSRAHQMRAR